MKDSIQEKRRKKLNRHSVWGWKERQRDHPCYGCWYLYVSMPKRGGKRYLKCNGDCEILDTKGCPKYIHIKDFREMKNY